MQMWDESRQNSQSSLCFSAVILFPFLPAFPMLRGWFGEFLSIPAAGVGTPHELPSNSKEWLHCCFPKHAKIQGGRTCAKPAPRILSLANSPAECFPSALQECQIINYYSTFCAGKQNSKQSLESHPARTGSPQIQQPQPCSTESPIFGVFGTARLSSMY